MMHNKQLHLISLLSGPILFATMLLLPLWTFEIRGALGLLLWMAAWWILRPVHMGVTAFLPLPILALFNIAPMEQILPSYADNIVILLLGASILTVTWMRWGLDKRLALLFLFRGGVNVKSQIFFWFVLSIMMSAVLPNTVVAATLIPIAVAMLGYLNISGAKIETSEFATGILLAIAWGTSVGGIGTPLGGAMNLLTMRLVEETVSGHEFMFWVWVTRMFPLMLLSSAVLLTYLLSFPFEINKVDKGAAYIKQSYLELGPITKEEKVCLYLFSITVVFTFLRPFYISILPLLHPAYIFLLAGIICFAITVRGKPLLTWQYAQPKIMWGLIYLFAGGIALGKIIDLSGAGLLFGNYMSIYVTSQLLGLAVFGSVAILLTNITSNTAACAIVIPIVISTSQSLGVNPIPFIYIAAAAANAGFILPSSSGGPALAAGYGVNVKKMALRGILAMLMTLIILCIAGYFISSIWERFWIV